MSLPNNIRTDSVGVFGCVNFDKGEKRGHFLCTKQHRRPTSLPPTPRQPPLYCTSKARCLHLCCRAVHYPRPGLVLCRTSFKEAKHGGSGGGGKGLSKRLEAEHVRIT